MVSINRGGGNSLTNNRADKLNCLFIDVYRRGKVDNVFDCVGAGKDKEDESTCLLIPRLNKLWSKIF